MIKNLIKNILIFNCNTLNFLELDKKLRTKTRRIETNNLNFLFYFKPEISFQLIKYGLLDRTISNPIQFSPNSDEPIFVD